MATCKGCGLAACTWGQRGKKWHLYEPSGTQHKCKNYRRPKPPAVLKITKGPTIRGELYRDPCATCPALPWESCACYPGMAEKINAEADARLTRALDLMEA